MERHSFHKLSGAQAHAATTLGCFLFFGTMKDWKTGGSRCPAFETPGFHVRYAPQVLQTRSHYLLPGNYRHFHILPAVPLHYPYVVHPAWTHLSVLLWRFRIKLFAVYPLEGETDLLVFNRKAGAGWRYTVHSKAPSQPPATLLGSGRGGFVSCFLSLGS